ncbi:MAG: hypothetical protein EXQ51_12985 [Acidobacteria bacterium]|nr:hypothetical protein [Acidobacteriota bacterium]
MKKILVGCLIVLVIAVVGFGVAGYYVYRASRPLIDSAADYVSRARELATLSEQVTNKTPYEPPAKGELTAGQVDRFLAVQGRVQSELGDRWTELEKKADALKKKADEKGSDWSFSDLSSVFSDFTGIYLQARKAHVNTLNIHKFSDEEFSWVRLRVYEAAGMQLAGSIDTSAIQEMARESAQKTGVSIPDLPMPDVPEANIKLVKPHAAKLKEWLPMAMLGL